jgi:hypothetical protein
MATFEHIHKYVIIFLVCTFSVTVTLKIGEIQYLELIMAADLLLVCFLFARNGFHIRVFRPFLSIGSTWGIFMALAFLLALVALRQDFYSFNDTFFKRPMLVTISRMAELFLDVFYMLYLASLYREDERLCRFGARTYYWMGVIGGIYAVVSFPINYVTDLQIGAYGDLHRLRGFDNEGGPYGNYLIGIILLTVAMWRRGWLSKLEFQMGIVLFSLCLIGSQSKAAIFAIALLVTINFLFLAKSAQRLALIGVLTVGLVAVAAVIDLPGKINIYVEGAAQYQNLSMLRSADANLVMGRIAGAVLSPRMIAAHPWLGIGWGNYPLVRDDPQYRRGTAFSLSASDAPSLGPIDYLVDLGFPLFFYLTWAEFKPLYLLWKHRVDIWIVNMAAMQILANWFGAHLNLTYQWVIVGLALGMGFAKTRPAGAPKPAIAA